MDYRIDQITSLGEHKPTSAEIAAGHRFVELWSRFIHGNRGFDLTLKDALTYKVGGNGLLVQPSFEVDRQTRFWAHNQNTFQEPFWNIVDRTRTSEPFVLDEITITGPVDDVDLMIWGETKHQDQQDGSKIKLQYHLDLGKHSVVLLHAKQA